MVILRGGLEEPSMNPYAKRLYYGMALCVLPPELAEGFLH